MSSFVANSLPKLMMIINWPIPLIGTFLNAFIFYVTLKDRSLHGTCNFLIGLHSIFDAFVQFSWVTIFTFIQIIQEKWTLLTCLFLSWPTMSGFVCSSLCILLIGCDRLICVIWPIWYRSKKSRKLYIPMLFIIVLLYYAWIMQFPIRTIIMLGPNSMVLCKPPSILAGIYNDLFHSTLLVVNLSTIGVYILLWILLRYHGNCVHRKETNRIFKSILAITLIVLGGWIQNSTGKMMAELFTANSIAQILLINCTKIVKDITDSSNIIVLYYFSPKYRIAFRRELSKLPKIGKAFKENEAAKNKIQCIVGGTQLEQITPIEN